MSEYISKEELLEFVDAQGKAYIKSDLNEPMPIGMIINILKKINSLPTVDLIRCYECKHLYFKDFNGYCSKMIGRHRPNDFCSLGERAIKEGE